jgi:hypothetical protein
MEGIEPLVPSRSISAQASSRVSKQLQVEQLEEREAEESKREKGEDHRA